MAGSIKLAAPSGGSVTLASADTAANFVMNVPAAAGVLINADSATGAAQLPVGTTAQRPASPVTGQLRYNSTLLSVEWWNGSAWTTSGGYSVDYLIVGGGGGGGGFPGGGGGAGGVLYGTTNIVSGTVSSVILGAGGFQATGQGPAQNGYSSVIVNMGVAIGGGAGGSYLSAGVIGGSGGGGATGAGGAGTSGQGFAGGSGNGTVCGGGGGATAVGGNNGGVGGAGYNWQSLGTYYGGGGGGYSAAGGVGGGGAGGAPPTAGTANTGGGGGGGGSVYNGSNGGSGIAIIRYLGSQRGTGGTVTSAGGYTYHTFTTSGTFTA